MDSKWDLNADILSDIRFAVSRMKDKNIPRKPNRIECTEETYRLISEHIDSRKKEHNDLIFLFGNPFNILFLQTDFSEWDSDDLKKGYKVIFLCW